MKFLVINVCIFIIIFLTIEIIYCNFLNISKNSICFGSLNFDLPLRYLHIQLVNQENSINLTHSIGRLNVFITNERCRFKFANFFYFLFLFFLFSLFFY